jgi:hypothetical protein
MADPIRRLQSGNVQVAGVSNLPQPNMNFGTQRPEIAYQAAGEQASTVGRVVSNLSTFYFGQAEKLAEAAGAQFIAENPITQAEIDAMVNGEKKDFSKSFSSNAFGAAVNRWREHELSAYFELQSVQKANDIQLSLETGRNKNGTEFKLDLKAIAEDWKATTDGNSAVLAQYSPNASYKYRATAAVHGNKLLVAAAKADSERTFLEKQVKVEQKIKSHSNSIKNIINAYADSDPAALQNELVAERQRMVAGALVLGGIPAQKLALEKSAEIELEVKTAMFQNHIFEGNLGDSVAFMDKVRKGLLPPSLQNVWNTMTPPEQRKVRDAIDSEFTALSKRREETKKVDDQKLNQDISSNLMIVYNKASTVEEKSIAMGFLQEQAKNRPDLITAKFVMVDLPKSLKEDIQDDPAGEAMLIQFLRESQDRPITVPEVLEKAAGLLVTPKTAIAIAEKYLPKDAKELERLKDLAEIEFDLRTKKIPKDDRAALKNALAARNLTLADAPSDFIRLLTEDLPESETKTNQEQYFNISGRIQRDEITDPVQLYRETKGFVISFSDKKQLESDLIARIQAKEASFAKAGKDYAGVFDSKSPSANSANELKGARLAEKTHQDLLAQHKQNGYFIDDAGEKQYRTPTTDDARDIVKSKAISDKSLKLITQQRESLNNDFGSNGIRFSENERKKSPRLMEISPTFKPGDPPKVDQNYIDKITREVMRVRGITDQKDLTKTDRMNIQDLIDQQQSIEKKQRDAGRR